MKNFKLEKGLLERLTKITNRSNGQTQFLFELCDCDFEKLLDLERKLKNNFVGWVPGDKESLNTVLNMGESSGWWDKMYGKLTFKKCKPMIRLKEFPQLSGLWNSELQADNPCPCCHHRKFYNQLGVHWNKEDLSKWIQNKGGLPNYWMDKDLFEMSRPYEENGKLHWDWCYERNKSWKQIKDEDAKLLKKTQNKLKKEI
jgi:hypothetical protein